MYEAKKRTKKNNQKHADPSNLLLRQIYHEKLKTFKILLKVKRQNYEAEMLVELEKNSNNTNFWKILKFANEDINESKLPPIKEQQWLNHFQSLHSRKEKNPEQIHIASNLLKMESLNQTNTELNAPITDTEIDIFLDS